MTLLSMCQQVAREVGMPVPSTIVGNNDEHALRLLACAQTEGQTLARGLKPNGRGRHHWTILRKEYTFNTTDGTEAYSLPSDFLAFVGDTWWDRANNRSLKLVSPQRWQYLKSGIVNPSGVDKEFIKRGQYIYISPTPSAVETLAFEYVSTQWCESSGGTDQTAWAADTDTGILDEFLMTQGIKWRFLQKLGEPYSDEKLEYQEQVLLAMAEDGGRSAINLTRSYRTDFYENIPDSGYGN